MMQLPRKVAGPHRRTRGYRAAAAITAVALGFGVTGCADSEGPERGVTADDLQDIEDRIGELEDRVGVIEDGDLGAEPDGPGDVDADVWTDPEKLLGQEVTVSAEVTEVLGGTASKVAFRIVDGDSEGIAVISTTAPTELDQEDVVQVTGTVKMLQESSFEDDFGVPANDVLEEPDAFFERADRQVAISASKVEILDDDV